MKEVFISYSSQDSNSAETVRDVLESNGLSCWMAPRDIPGGSDYTKEIPVAIRDCTVFVLILSQNAQDSQWVLKELSSAVSAGKVILPFMLEDCALNDEVNFLLTGAQRYDAYRKKSNALETLIRRIQSILHPQDIATEVPVQEKPSILNAPDPILCPSCRGTALRRLPLRTKRHGSEIFSLLFIPLFVIVGLIVGLILDMFVRIKMPWMLICMVLGGFLGDLISRTSVRRRRLRKQINSVCYRCKRCHKVFRHDTPLN